MDSRTNETIILSGTIAQKPITSKRTIRYASLTVMCVLLSAGAGRSGPAGASLHKVLGLWGEFGIVAVQGNTISMFSPETISTEDAGRSGQRMERAPHGAFSVEITDGKWKKVLTHLPLSAAHRPALCDRLNQIDLASIDTDFARALPAGARIKSLQELDSLALAVYTLSDRPVEYDVRIGLLQRAADSNYLLLETELVSEDGNFCGIQPAGKGNYLLFTVEPAASSDFLGVYVYAVTP